MISDNGRLMVGTETEQETGTLQIQSPSAGVDTAGGHGILIENRATAGSNGARRYFDVYQAYTGASSNVYHYIRTNMNTSGNVMYRAHIIGYNYGTSKILDLTAVGYAYASGSSLTAMQNSTLHSSGATIESYLDSSNNVVLKIYVGTSSYYCGFRMDIQFDNPTGYTHNFRVIEAAWSGSSTNMYT